MRADPAGGARGLRDSVCPMRAPVFGPAIALLAIGGACGVIGMAGVLRDTAAALRLPERGAARAVGQAAPAPRLWVRTCLESARCRLGVTSIVTAAIVAHAQILRLALLLGGGACIWAIALRAEAADPRPPTGEARFADRGDLRRLIRRSRVDWFPLGYVSRSMACRGRPFLRSRASLTEEDLGRHVLVIGLTGAHKTTAITFPVLLEAARADVSIVALDLKYGEDDSLILAAPEWWRRGRDVLVFAPLDPVSLRWNPLRGCRTIGAAHRFAALLFDDTADGNPDLFYWIGAERQVCAALCVALATDGGPVTLERLRVLCEAGPGAVQAYVQAHPAAHRVAAHLGTYRAMLPKDEAGILQGIATRLEAWADETVCRATGIGGAWDGVDLGRLRREPVLLIVGIPQAALGRLRALCRLFLLDLASRLLSPRRADEQIRVVQVLEELPAWGPLPGLADNLATFRSRRVSVLATVQSEAQGEHVYGRDGWAAIAANLATKIYFPLLSDGDADRLSRALGTTSGEDVARARGWGANGRHMSEHRREIPVPLRRPEELQGIDAAEDEILLRSPRRPAARLWCPPFYVRPEYRDSIPDRPPATAELVVYHHLWHRRNHSDEEADVPPDGRTSGSGPEIQGSPAEGYSHERPGQTAPVRSEPPVPAGASGRPEYVNGPADRVRPQKYPDDARATPSPEELEVLSQFVQRLVSDPRVRLRAARRGDRLIEVRIDPVVALRFLARPDNASGILRRWAELRWVRRLRPVFVLERRAVDALDPMSRQRLAGMCVDRSD